MIKNILKSAVYFVLYFALQIVCATVLLFVDIFTGALTFTNMEDFDLMFSELEAHLYVIAVPSLIVTAILFFLFFIIYKKVRKHPFDFKTIEWKNLLFFASVGLLLNVVITLIVSSLAYVLPADMVSALDQSTGAALTGNLFVMLIGTGILAPILEELVFRYGICGTLARSNATFALIASSLIFGIVHGNVIQAAYATILGLFFGFIYLKTKNIWYPAILHMAVNSSSVIVSYTNAVWLYAVFAVVAAVVIIVMIHKCPELKNIFKKNVYLENNTDNL